VKRIRKGQQPHALIRWRATNAAIPDARYGTHRFPTADVHKALIKEQGGICAYTMIRIEENSSHIEHLKPQTVSRTEGKPAETAAYDNMVACYPRVHVSGTPSVAFGAIYRGSKWDVMKFISPLTSACETAFCYRLTGKIEASPKSNGKAKWMISTLKLDAEELDELRLAAIEAMGLSLTAQDAVSLTQAKRLLDSICNIDGAGRFHPYCIAIKHAAIDYIRLVERESKRISRTRAARKRRKK
jgi:uncharacterized protein (TIGR02646 family)